MFLGESKENMKHKIRLGVLWKAWKLVRNKNMLINSFWGDVFSLFIILKYIICFNVVVFSNFANNVKFKYFCLDTLNLITLRTYFSSFSRKKFNDSFFAPCLEHKLVFWFCHRHILRYYLHLGKHYGFFGNCLDHFWNGNKYDHHRN